MLGDRPHLQAKRLVCAVLDKARHKAEFSMVRRGSTVRVRQRLWKAPQTGALSFELTCTRSSMRWVWAVYGAFRSRTRRRRLPSAASAGSAGLEDRLGMPCKKRDVSGIASGRFREHWVCPRDDDVAPSLDEREKRLCLLPVRDPDRSFEPPPPRRPVIRPLLHRMSNRPVHGIRRTRLSPALDRVRNT